MKRGSMLAMAVMAAVGFARTARADDVPVTVEISRVTYYRDLSKMPGDKSEALVALLRREFPDATIEVIDGTLRMQADGKSDTAVHKLLDSLGLQGLPVPDKKDGEKKIKREKMDRKPAFVEEHPAHEQMEAIREHLKRLGKEMGKVGEARGEPTKIKVRVGDLCEGCADCLAGALGKEFPGLKFFPDETDVVVLADAAGQAAVQAWLSGLRGMAKAAPADEEEREIIVLEDVARVIELPAGAMGDPRRHVARIERALEEARKAGREREVQKLEGALEGARAQAREFEGIKDRRAARGLGEGTIGRDDVERHFEGLRGERAGEDLGALRERFEALRARLEGAKGRRPGRAPPVAAPHDPRAKEHKKEQPQGPMAEWRKRVMHLKQAVEHLNAAGYEGLAKQAAEAAAQAAAQAEEVARKLRAAEEAREAEQRKAERARAEGEEARAREHKKARVEAGPEREGGDELTTLIRRLHQQVEELRKEVRELREKVGGERREGR